MFNELNKIISSDKISHEITICDPCIGGGNLLKPFIEKYDNLNIKGCEINKYLAMNTKIELIINGIETININIFIQLITFFGIIK